MKVLKLNELNSGVTSAPDDFIEISEQLYRKGIEEVADKLLSQEAELEEMVKLVGIDALSPTDRLKMEAARSIREDFLHQLAFYHS